VVILSERSTPLCPASRNYKEATSKRFRLTGSGLLVRTKGGKSHLRRRTSKRTSALFTEMVTVKGRSIIKRVRRLVPNMK
jgi:large subunit ribosomal protein L35